MPSTCLPPLEIRDVKVILTAPNGIRLVVVKVVTSEPGLYSLGSRPSPKGPWPSRWRST